MSFLKMWFTLTVGILAVALMWSFAPVIIPVLLVAGGLALLVLGIVAAARRLEARRQRGG